jgi:hypothetical protein
VLHDRSLGFGAESMEQRESTVPLRTVGVRHDRSLELGTKSMVQGGSKKKRAPCICLVDHVNTWSDSGILLAYHLDCSGRLSSCMHGGGGENVSERKWPLERPVMISHAC